MLDENQEPVRRTHTTHIPHTHRTPATHLQGSTRRREQTPVRPQAGLEPYTSRQGRRGAVRVASCCSHSPLSHARLAQTFDVADAELSRRITAPSNPLAFPEDQRPGAPLCDLLARLLVREVYTRSEPQP